ncbi:MAG TPA: alpha/beta fold hydrolase [Rudaea sp.]|jgi:proline iminopeptidase
MTHETSSASHITDDTYDQGWLDVGHGHRMYYLQAGNPDGLPIVLLHGGPASGSTPRQRIFYDHRRYRIVQFDQRGCGRSEPLGEIAHNHTAALIDDIERLRVHLVIERWLVSGGSWGSALGLAYAAAHQACVTGLLLRGMFLTGRADLEWYFDGAGVIAPQAYQEFIEHIPRRWRRRVLTYIDRSLKGPDAEKAMRLTAAWQRYESALNGADVMPAMIDAGWGSPAAWAKYRIQAHYLAQRCFLGQSAMLRAAASLKGVPVALLHGTRDLVCRPVNAWLVHRACSGSRLAWAQGAGHDPYHPAAVALTREAAGCFAADGNFSRWPGSGAG